MTPVLEVARGCFLQITQRSHRYFKDIVAMQRNQISINRLAVFVLHID